MAKLSKKVSAKSSIDALPSVDSPEADPRPLSSPYTSTYIKIFFGANAKAMKVPKALLQKCSNLPDDNIVLANSLHLTHIPEEVGHVLVHHLFTETLQCLAPKGSTNRERQATELMTCIRAYAVAWDYELASLKEQARSEIERLGECLPVTGFLAALDEVYPHPSKDDIWLGGYLKIRMKALFADRQFMKGIESTHAGPKSSIAELVFRSALRLREEDLELINGLNEPGQICCEDAPEPDPEVELAYCESAPEPAHEYQLVCQEVAPEPISEVAPEPYEAMPAPEPVYAGAVPVSPCYEAIPEPVYDDEPAYCGSEPDPGPAEGDTPAEPAMNDAAPTEVMPTSEEIPLVSSGEEPVESMPVREEPIEVLETPWQDKTVFVPSSEPDSSSPVFTPPSSTTSCISDSAKVQSLKVEVTHKEEAETAPKKLSRIKVKKAMKRKLREAQAIQEPDGLYVVCESMSQHLKLGGEWKDCKVCRNLVGGLAAEL